MAEATATAPGDLRGKWKLDRNENFDEFMKAAGIGLVRRKMISSFTPVIEIHQDGDDFKFTTKIAVGTRETAFKLGVEYLESNPMWGDKEQRVLAEWNGAKLVQRVVLAEGDEIPKSIEREVVDGELVLTIRRGDMETKRYFKKV